MNLYGFAGGDPVNFSDPFGLLECDREKEPCPNPIAQAAQGFVNAFTDLYLKTLDVISDALNLVTGVKSAVTAAGLNPNAQDATSRVGGAVDVAMGLTGPFGESARPALKLLHAEKNLSKASLAYFRKQGTEDIVRSLQPGMVEPLIVNARGTVMQGNHRIFVLMERGFDVNSLPRTPYP